MEQEKQNKYEVVYWAHNSKQDFYDCLTQAIFTKASEEKRKRGNYNVPNRNSEPTR